MTDSSNSAKIARTSVAFDGTTTTQALSKKGTFETFSKFSGSYTDLTNKPSIPTTANDISYDNTDSGLTATDVQGAVDELAQSYPANKVMMSDGVTSVEEAIDELTADTIGTAVNVSSYTSSNKYTCPSDGYVNVYIGSGNSGTIDGDGNLSIGGYQGRYAMPVKKGMKVYITGTVNYAYFIPLT